MMYVIHSLLSGAWAVRAPAPAVCSSGTTLPGQGFWRAWVPLGPRRPCGPTAQVPLRTGITATETVRKRVATYPRTHSHPHTRRITRSHRTSSVPAYPGTHVPTYPRTRVPTHTHTHVDPLADPRALVHIHTHPRTCVPAHPFHPHILLFLALMNPHIPPPPPLSFPHGLKQALAVTCV